MKPFSDAAVSSRETSQLGNAVASVLYDAMREIRNLLTDSTTPDVARIQAKVDAALQSISECDACVCDYFTHYLSYGPAELTHEGYHSAEKRCIELQKRLEEYFDNHPDATTAPLHLERLCADAERLVRA